MTGPERAAPDAEHTSELPPPSAQEDVAWEALPEQAPYDRLGAAADASVAVRDRARAAVKKGAAAVLAGVGGAIRAARSVLSRAGSANRRPADAATPPSRPGILERHRDAKDDVE